MLAKLPRSLWRFAVLASLAIASTGFAQTPTTRLQPWPDAIVVAKEYERFAVPANTVVWFGNADRWVTKVVSGDGICDTGFFGLKPFDGPQLCAVEYPPGYKSAGGLTFSPVFPTRASCSFSPKGDGTAPVVEVNSAGVAMGWWCKRSVGPGGEAPTPVLHLYAIRWSAITLEWLYSAAVAAMSSDITDRVNSMAVKATTPIGDVSDVWGPAEARLLASRPD